MSKNLDGKHTQCALLKGNIHYTAWIPAIYAKENAYVQIDFEGVWSNGWKVEKVFDTMDSKVIAERSQDYKRTRKLVIFKDG